MNTHSVLGGGDAIGCLYPSSTHEGAGVRMCTRIMCFTGSLYILRCFEPAFALSKGMIICFTSLFSPARSCVCGRFSNGCFRFFQTVLVGSLFCSAPILYHKEKNMDGSAVCVYMEGSRPILCELQSLVTYSRLPSPRRTSGIAYTVTRHVSYGSQKDATFVFARMIVLSSISYLPSLAAERHRTRRKL